MRQIKRNILCLIVSLTKQKIVFHLQRYGRIQGDDPATHLLKWSDGHWEGGRENGRSLKADLSGRQPRPPPIQLPYLPGGGLPLPFHPLPPFTQLSLTRDRRLPLAAEPQKWYNCRNSISFHLGDFATVLGSLRFREDTDFMDKRQKQRQKRKTNHSYWQQGRKGLNDWDRWRKVLIWFHKLPLRQLDYNSSTAVAAIFQKMEITNLSSAAFSWVAVPSFLNHLQNFGFSNDHTIN